MIEYTYAQVRQPYPVALSPQQIGETGEYLSQRYGYSWYIQPQFPERMCSAWNGYLQPPSVLAQRTATLAYGVYSGLQRQGSAPSGGTGPAYLGPTLGQVLAQQVAPDAQAARAALAVWSLSNPQTGA